MRWNSTSISNKSKCVKYCLENCKKTRAKHFSAMSFTWLREIRRSLLNYQISHALNQLLVWCRNLNSRAKSLWRQRSFYRPFNGTQKVNESMVVVSSHWKTLIDFADAPFRPMALMKSKTLLQDVFVVFRVAFHWLRCTEICGAT